MPQTLCLRNHMGGIIGVETRVRPCAGWVFYDPFWKLQLKWPFSSTSFQDLTLELLVI